MKKETTKEPPPPPSRVPPVAIPTPLPAVETAEAGTMPIKDQEEEKAPTNRNERETTTNNSVSSRDQMDSVAPADDEERGQSQPQSPFHGFPSLNATPEELMNDSASSSLGSESGRSDSGTSHHSELKNEEDDDDDNRSEGSISASPAPALQPVPFHEHPVTDALTIEIPPNAPETMTRSTRSGTRIISPETRRSSPRQQSPAEENKQSATSTTAAVVFRKSSRRKRNDSGSSGTSDPPSSGDRQTPTTMDQTDGSSNLSTRPNKRKCSENASEMIKVCMGLEDTPRKVVSSNNDSSATAHNSGPLTARKQQRQGSIDDPASIVLKRRKFSYFNYSVFHVKIQFQLFVF